MKIPELGSVVWYYAMPMDPQLVALVIGGKPGGYLDLVVFNPQLKTIQFLNDVAFGASHVPSRSWVWPNYGVPTDVSAANTLKPYDAFADYRERIADRHRTPGQTAIPKLQPAPWQLPGQVPLHNF
jgi:hypothetical protein